MTRHAWLLTVIGWDGCLPSFVALAPVILPEIIPDRHLANITAIIFVPMIAALVRAWRGICQFEHRGIRPTTCRQLGCGCAIIILMVFEASLGGLVCGGNAPIEAWLMAMTIYLIYLCLMVPSLRPPRLNDA